ncbi:MAG: hypothetical protein KUF74_03585 [Candidatus Thiodiazotropha sp. (ex Ctena orbiculata)]|nr:hypothetical protein [Candidatus Thiodiazotropha taylori]
MVRRTLKGMAYERKQRAAFLRATRVVLKNHRPTSSVTYDICLINKVSRAALSYRTDALSKRPYDSLIEISKPYGQYKKKLQRKYEQFQNVLDFDDTPLNDEFFQELKKVDVSVDTANKVLNALDKAIYSTDLIFTKKNQRPRHKDYYFNVPLGELLSDSGFNRKESSRLIAQIRSDTNTLMSDSMDIDKLSKRIEDQLSSHSYKRKLQNGPSKLLLDKLNKVTREKAKTSKSS